MPPPAASARYVALRQEPGFLFSFAKQTYRMRAMRAYIEREQSERISNCPQGNISNGAKRNKPRSEMRDATRLARYKTAMRFFDITAASVGFDMFPAHARETRYAAKQVSRRDEKTGEQFPGFFSPRICPCRRVRSRGRRSVWRRRRACRRVFSLCKARVRP